MTSTTFHVDGMTCAHCVGAVTREVSALPGVTGVRIDLPSGAVSVESDATLAEQAIEAAVEEAGYVLRRPDQLKMADR